MVKNPPANVGDSGDVGSIPELGRSPGRGNGNLFQYSCLEKSHGQRSQTWLSTRPHLFLPDFKAVIYIYSTYKYLVRYIYLKYLFPFSSLHLQILSVLLFCFFFFLLATPCGMWVLGSPTRDWTKALQWKLGSLTTGPPTKSLHIFFLWREVLSYNIVQFISVFL